MGGKGGALVPGAGSILRLATGEFSSTLHDGDAAGLALAKAALGAGGHIQMGPGTEGIALGAGWGIIGLARCDALGRMFISRFHMTDGADPTKALLWDLSAITTATIRTAVAPNYGGFLLLPADLGVSGQFLKSNGAGVQPTWAGAGINNLLDGANHSDTVAQNPTRGSLIYGNSTPRWDELPIGVADTFLGSDGTDVLWRGASSASSLIQHDLLLHLKPISVTNCTWTNTSAVITHASSGFANVKVGDFIYLGTNTTVSTQGARVLTWTNANSITADVTNTGGTLTNQTFIFQPGDHWDNTLALNTGTGAGLLMATGRGTYNATNTSGTFQEVRGPIRWTGQGTAAGILTDFRVMGSGSTSTKSGFCIDGAPSGATGKVYFFVAAGLANDSVLIVPDIDPTANVDTLVVTGLAQTLSSKTLSGSNTKIVSDGSTNNAVFQSGGGADFLSFSAVGTTLRNVSSPDYAGRNRVEGAPVTFANGDTTPSVALSRVFKTNNAAGTTVTALDDGVSGQEVTIIATDANTTLQHAGGGSLRLQGSVNYTMGVDDTIRLVNDGTNWYENGRTVI